MIRLPIRPLALLLLLSLAAGALSTAAARSLTPLLPADTVFALGLEDIASHEAAFEPFIEEFQRLEVGRAFARLGGATEAELEDLSVEGEMPEALRELELFDVLGQEAWLAVSVSAYNPLPAVTIITRLSDRGVSAISEFMATDPEVQGSQQLTEGDYTFFVEPLDQEDQVPGFAAIAFAQAEDLLLFSSNPEVLRGALRRLGGTSEPNFANSPGFAASLGGLRDGNAYTYFDYAQVAAAVQPFAQGLGFDQLIARLVRAFATAGVHASSAAITADGYSSEGVQALDRDGGDTLLFGLLTDREPASRDALAFTPGTALSVAASSADPAGWWGYLNDLLASSPELGIPSLEELLMTMVGVDVRSGFLDWAGNQSGVIVTGIGEAAVPGVASENLLGETVYLIEATDESAAQVGLANQLATLSAIVSGFADPMGQAGTEAARTRESSGVTVGSYDFAPGVTIAYAVTNGYALVATSDEAIDEVLAAVAAGGDLRSDLEGLLGSVPSNAISYSLVDNRATLEGTAELLASQLQLTAGLAGSEGLDFDAVEEASETITEFVRFIASRLGNTVGYSQVEGALIRSLSNTQVDW